MTPQEVEQLKEVLRSYGQNQTETIREELEKVGRISSEHYNH